MNINNSDTKSKIFNTSLRLFAANGYENVSMRNIADAVGIKVASIYYHYTSKEQILFDCYSFYAEHRYENRPKKEQYEHIIRNGAKKEILMALFYSFPEAVDENMTLCLYAILSRMHSDSRAMELYKEELNGAMQYTADIFKFGIEIGRFNEFNIYAVASLYISAGMFAAQTAIIGPDELNNLFSTHSDMYTELINLIPFRY